jgi:hypothetical protein
MLGVVMLSVVAPGACTLKLFTAVIIVILKEAGVFAASIHFHPRLYVWLRLGTQHESEIQASIWWATALSANITLEWK